MPALAGAAKLRAAVDTLLDIDDVLAADTGEHTQVGMPIWRKAS
jgi:hypothetical protein